MPPAPPSKGRSALMQAALDGAAELPQAPVGEVALEGVVQYLPVKGKSFPAKGAASGGGSGAAGAKKGKPKGTQPVAAPAPGAASKGTLQPTTLLKKKSAGAAGK